MAGIYIHIPFCKQACFYCDFHFSTSLKHSKEMLLALIEEIKLRKNEISGKVETIYLGGGTPSLLGQADLEKLFNTIYSEFDVSINAEITLEANPDDLNSVKLNELSNSPINRLSIGVQSFFEEHLQLMNRAHDSKQAHECLQLATEHFKNITVDLIYGIPKMTLEQWDYNLQQVLRYKIPHLSCYALTVEPNTALDSFIKTGKYPPIDETLALKHFSYLQQQTADNGFVHYEISNFGKPNFFSRHNTSYWNGEQYLGIGPSAHSFNGLQRSWNVSNNVNYIKAIQNNQLPSEAEKLTIADQFNEYVMTGLRTIWGVSFKVVKERFGASFENFLRSESKSKIKEGSLIENNDVLLVSEDYKFLADGIASDLFYIEEE